MRAPIQVVDKNDKIIGHKTMAEFDYENDIYRVAALWLTNSNGEVLIAQRKFTKDKDPGLWGPAVAGTIDKGETYESNIYKETEEEIGLTGIRFKLGPKLFIKKPRKHFTQWFVAACDWDIDRFRIEEDEVEKIEWVSPGRLKVDVKNHPEKYVSQMPLVVVEFI